MHKLRLLTAVTFASAGAMATVVACSEDPATSPDSADGGGSEAGARPDGGTSGGGDGSASDAGGGGNDAAKDAGKMRDANGPGEAGTECIFNHDCALALRCGACDAGYCFCEPGPRGTGRNGVDKCDAGEQCESALCVEGPGGANDYCSDACEGDHECTGALPKCVNVPFFAMFCARDGG